MKDCNKEQILETYGNQALVKVEKWKEDSSANLLLIYAEDDVFEILGGMLTNRSLSLDEVTENLEIDMDEFADMQGWDGWNYEALDLIFID